MIHPQICSDLSPVIGGSPKKSGQRPETTTHIHDSLNKGPQEDIKYDVLEGPRGHWECLQGGPGHLVIGVWVRAPINGKRCRTCLYSSTQQILRPFFGAATSRFLLLQSVTRPWLPTTRVNGFIGQHLVLTLVTYKTRKIWNFWGIPVPDELDAESKTCVS